MAAFLIVVRIQYDVVLLPGWEKRCQVITEASSQMESAESHVCGSEGAFFSPWINSHQCPMAWKCISIPAKKIHRAC